MTKLVADLTGKLKIAGQRKIQIHFRLDFVFWFELQESRKFMTSRLFILLVLTCMLMFACGKKQETKPPPPPIKVGAATVERGAIEENLYMSGNLRFIADTTVSSQVSAQITSIEVRDGQPVSKGQRLLLFDDSIIRATADQARGTLQKDLATEQLAKIDMDKNAPLAKTGAISELTFDQKASAYQTAHGQVTADKGALAKAEEDLKNTVVVAPITGILSNRFVEVGDWAATGGKLFQISDYTTVYLETYLSDKDVAALDFSKVIQQGYGGDAEITVDSLPGQKFKGKIGYVQAVVNQNQLFQVRLYIKNPELKLLEGMYARGRVLVNSIPNVVRAPLDALLNQIRHNEGNSVVKISKDNRAEITQIKIGATDDNYAQILDGLAPGDRVVTEGREILSTGQPLEIVNSKDPQKK
ncbi:MAG: efflux RND transporter periplasmic adaptor subunit [Desulfomonilaceae bacterium]